MDTAKLNKKIPELIELQEILSRNSDIIFDIESEEVAHQNLRLPIYQFAMGSRNKKAPTLILVGGWNLPRHKI